MRWSVRTGRFFSRDRRTSETCSPAACASARMASSVSSLVCACVYVRVCVYVCEGYLCGLHACGSLLHASAHVRGSACVHVTILLLDA